MVDKNEYENTIYQFKTIINKINDLKNSTVQLENTEKNNMTINDEVPCNDDFDNIKKQLDLLYTELTKKLNNLSEEYKDSLSTEASNYN